jgi:hypothetical protein
MKKEQVSNMRKVKTHFEQVPVEVVKKIAEEEQKPDPDEKESTSPNVVVETPAMKTDTYSVGVMNCRNRA